MIFRKNKKPGKFPLGYMYARINAITQYSRLQLPLPNKINENKGKAEWIAEKDQLVLTLPLKHDFAF